MVEYRTRNREVAGSIHTQSTASNLEEFANLLCAQANSASYPVWYKWVVAYLLSLPNEVKFSETCHSETKFSEFSANIVKLL